ncbi:DJ-1/PfpI family protein [Vitiosangium sp. GDMCC 1.1324]|uniref:DJ-1/PfpI family protein n=1 Tax=Vitiosangium sp. (strain GDMCC 1.1324) TaxID=2138576 RepID=UPI000D3BD4E5|nr:DJ-1/PfpI family protein [Vitiosangium sp. GDMCC 1.1324]PTL81159.1 transcriptional regulator [Vitiosangium sp. GDMCC 1.1324]
MTRSNAALVTLVAGLIACTGAPVAPDNRPLTLTSEEQAETLAGLRPPKRARPVIAVLGLNDGSETTDFLVPYGVLRRSGVADVVAVGIEAGPITLMPALTLQPQATVAELDARYPDGVDYVFVPAMHRDDEPAVLAWLKTQAEKGATLVGICEGAKVLGKAGLLDGRAATTHWHSVEALRSEHPTMRWVRNRRYVVDRGVVTTTGVTASLPVSLAVVEAIAGRARAEELARELGVTSWSAEHDSDAFQLGWGHIWTAIGNTVAIWNHEDVALPVEPGMDELALAFTADAYSRTYRSQAKTVAAVEGELTTAQGLQLVPDLVEGSAAGLHRLPPLPQEAPAGALDAALDGITERYGRRTAAFVALQLEYPWADGRK